MVFAFGALAGVVSAGASDTEVHGPFETSGSLRQVHARYSLRSNRSRRFASDLRPLGRCSVSVMAAYNKSLGRSHRQRASHQTDPVLLWRV